MLKSSSKMRQSQAPSAAADAPARPGGTEVAATLRTVPPVEPMNPRCSRAFACSGRAKEHRSSREQKGPQQPNKLQVLGVELVALAWTSWRHAWARLHDRECLTPVPASSCEYLVVWQEACAHVHPDTTDTTRDATSGLRRVVPSVGTWPSRTMCGDSVVRCHTSQRDTTSNSPFMGVTGIRAFRVSTALSVYRVLGPSVVSVSSHQVSRAVVAGGEWRGRIASEGQ